MTELADGGTCLVEQLCRERTGTNASAVGLHDAIDLANAIRTNTKTGASSGTDGVGGGYKWIASEINIEHCALGTLAEDRLTLTQKTVDLVLRIDNGE